MLPVASSGGVVMCYVLPVLWMASRLPIIGQGRATRVGNVLKLTHQGPAELVRFDLEYGVLVVRLRAFAAAGRSGRCLMHTVALFWNW